MNNRSYLDSLNMGRQRRPRASLDDLNRSLDDLESRFGRRPPEGFARADDDDGARRPPRVPGASDDYYHDLRPSPSHAPRGANAYADDQAHSIEALRREIERSRREAESSSALSSVSEEMKRLRDEMHHQMTAGLRQEFDSLRKDIEASYAAAANAPSSHELSAEMDRLSGAIHQMADRSDDRGVSLLRLELEQVRETLADLAREETVRSMDSRWAEIERRSAVRAEPDPAILALTARLEEIGQAVGNLPDSRSLRSLEEKVRTLATAVDHFSRQSERPSPKSFETIEHRLDEISRAIVASAVSAQPYGPEPFERIEARIAQLAQQLGELADDRPSAEVIDRLNGLARRVDEVARQAALPERAIERLGQQMAIIGEQLESGSNSRERAIVLESLESRFAEIAALFEKRHDQATAQGQALFRDLDLRLQALASRLESREQKTTATDPALLRMLDERFADIAERIDMPRQTGAEPDVIDAFERRLEEISSRLEHSTRRTAELDPKLIRSLESQVAGLAAHLARPVAPTPKFDELTPRLDGIERSLMGQRDAIIAAARDAADSAVRSMRGAGPDSEDAAALAHELKSLEALARKSDERNSRTFEAIHDTLLKVVDRLGSLETRGNDIVSAYRAKITPDHVPPIAPQPMEPARVALEAAPIVAAPALRATEPRKTPPQKPAPQPVLPPMSAQPPAPAPTPPQPRRSPAEAAAQAAAEAAATSAVAVPEAATPRTSMLGGLARALKGRKAKAPTVEPAHREPVLAGMEAVGLDEPLDSAIADKPLEPGSGAPDLNAIMKRVRDERAQSAQHSDPAAAKADFIAAARRAAQAAAAEAETFRRSGKLDGSARKFSPAEFVRAQRKPILIAAAAIMIALAGLQIGKAFFASDQDVAVTESGAPAAGGDQLVAAAPEAGDPTDGAVVDDVAGEVRVVDGQAMDDAQAEEPVATDAPVAPVAPDAADPAASAAAMPAEQPVDAAAATEAPAPEPAAEAPKPAVEPAPVEAGPIALREAADAGDPKAVFEIGSRYAEGRGVTLDNVIAAKWYERAAELGFAPAQYRIGNFYEKGIGVERDLVQAKTWYQLAADQGNASAMHNLAVLFAMGSDGTTDNDSAARWFQRAAELGVKDSQFNLGILAAKGAGVPQSLEESYKWFALVAKTGDKDAAAKRDEVANALRPEQLAKARAATELWKPKPVIEETNIVEIPDAWRESQGTTAGIDMKKAVQSIQLILKKNGYDAGSADGVMGEKTKKALAAFQKANGMEPTGEINETVVKALLAKK